MNRGLIQDGQRMKRGGTEDEGGGTMLSHQVPFSYTVPEFRAE
jgi:hypothetical protein